MQTAPPDCIKCKHFHGWDKWTCRAFPDKIPDKIFTGEHDHRKSFKGDNGIRFEEKE